MGFYFGSMLLTVISNVGYHLSQRSISARINPLLSLLLTYTVAMAATLIAYPFFSSSEGGSLFEQIRSANWATYLLGLALVGLELGFLLAYRAGWKVSLAALYSNALVAILLIPVGLFIFREELDLRKIAGVVLASAGLWLMSARS
jgi:drug/metabolite transporter (DMT)-like permease